MNSAFKERLENLHKAYDQLINRTNTAVPNGNGIFERYEYPILTAAHAPLTWRYDFNPETNPFLMERFGINAVFNAGAIKWEGKYLMAARIEGVDRKSFFAIAESTDGISFTFWNSPIVIPQNKEGDVNIYDMRLVQHADGWIYGVFCTERRDAAAGEDDQSAAVAQCGLVRTKDMLNWERLPDLKTPSPQQRNVVLHPELVNNKYFFYTRPQDTFIDAGSGGGIGYGWVDDILNPVIDREMIIDKKVYHTIYEAKNGLGPPPIKTTNGWLHLAHGVRHTAAGLRYTLYLFMTDINDITKVIHKPAGYLLAPEGEERIGDVSNVAFSNGWILDDDGTVFIYYASSDSRMHVATSSIERLIDYVINTPEDGLTSDNSVKQVIRLVNNNLKYLTGRDGSGQEDLHALTASVGNQGGKG
jgi:4-O-beta-D-mannosyl-D-glucose phosphorylase